MSEISNQMNLCSSSYCAWVVSNSLLSWVVDSPQMHLDLEGHSKPADSFYRSCIPWKQFLEPGPDSVLSVQKRPREDSHRIKSGSSCKTSTSSSRSPRSVPPTITHLALSSLSVLSHRNQGDEYVWRRGLHAMPSPRLKYIACFDDVTGTACPSWPCSRSPVQSTANYTRTVHTLESGC